MKTLQETFQEYKLMTAKECMDSIGWTTENDETSSDTGGVSCGCGGTISFGGWMGTEHAWCPECHKGMQNVTGVLPHGKNGAGAIDYKNTVMPDDGRLWIPENVWGF